MRKVALFMICVLLVTCIFGCGGGGKDSAASPTKEVPGGNRVIQIGVTEKPEGDIFEVQMPDGTKGGSELLVPLLTNQPPEKLPEMILKVEDSRESDSRLRVGRYYIGVYWDSGWLGGCVQRNVGHLNFLIKDAYTNYVICDVHITIWRENGPQAGIYITRGPDHNTSAFYCATTRGTYTRIKSAVRSGLSRTNLSAWYAAELAAAIALVAKMVYAIPW